MTPLDSQSTIAFSAAFTAGVLGSAHCFAMCGGLAGALGMRARAQSQTPARSFINAFATQLGRVGSYALIGAIVGSSGAVLSTVMAWVHLAALLRVLAGSLLIAIALRIAFTWNLFAWLERVGAQVWSRYLSKLAPKNTVRQAGLAQSLLLGAVWGWLPCGLVYSMLLFAVFAGSALQGALVMLAFGVGTLPSMLSSSLLAAQLARILKVPRVRGLAALALAAMGAWTIVLALQHSIHH